MSDCKCKNILNLQPKCEPVLDLNPNCPVTLNVASVSRGPKGNDATINGYNAINIDTAGGLIGTMDDQTQTYTIDGSAKQDVIEDLETIRSGAALGATAVQSVTEGTENGTISVDGTDVAVHGLGSAAYTESSEYDIAGAANTAETNAKNYADGLASNYATAAQGELADTALQPGDNISELNNDVGYITSAALPTNYVTTDTAQSVTGAKNFTQINNANGNSLAAYNAIQSTNDIGNTSENLRLQGNGERPRYRSGGNVTSFLALQTDIPTMTAGTGIDITANAISVTEPTVVNNGTGTKALAVGKTSQSTAEGGVAVGYGARANSTYGTAVGYESRANNTNTTAIGKQAKASNARAIAIGSGAEANADDAIAIKGINNTANTFQVYTYNMLDMSTGLIPDARINSNTFATKNYVDDSVSTNTAYFDGSWPTYADIPSTVAGFTNENLPEPTNNNYLVVLEDETQDGGTWRYKYVDDGGAYDKANWSVEYEVNETPFTQAQLDAINSGVTSSDVSLAQSALQSGDNVSELVNDAGYITSAALPTVNDATLTIQKNGTSVGTFTANASSNVTANIVVPTDTSDLTNGAGFITGITSGDVTTALGYTPYDSSNPNGYITGITSGDVTTALGYTPYDSSNPSGYISGITSGDITTALGYTPADDSGVVKLTGNQTISGTKSFNASLTRTSTIDPSTTTGETEVRTLSTVTNNGSTVIASYNATRSATTFSNRQRVNNPNVSNGWFDLRVNVNDAGQAYVNCTGSSSVTNLSMTQVTSSTSTAYIPTMGWVNNSSTAKNVVHRDSAETISGNKTFTGANTFSGNNSFTGNNTFTKQIVGLLAGYSATNSASNANPYKKIAECVLTGAYQTFNIPFLYFRTNTNALNTLYFGRVCLRTEGTAGTLSTTSSSVNLDFYPDAVNSGGVEFFICYKNNTPESNKVTCEVWVYIQNTYSGITVMPIRQSTGGSGYSSAVTWGNNLDEQASLPDGYSVINQNFVKSYTATPSDDNTSSHQIDTVGARNTKINSVMNSILPTGSILPFGGSSAPTGFLLCDGSAVSRTDYADLFDVIGTTYGSGDGSTTFNLPNLSTAVLPSSSTVSVVGNGNALGIVDDISTEAKQHNALIVGSGSSSFSSAKVPFAKFELSDPLAIGSQASSAQEFGTVRKALGVSTLPEWSGLTGSITGVTFNYIIRT